MRSGGVRRCAACKRRTARRVPCAPALMTDTNLARGVVAGARVAGFRVETRADLRAMERAGYGIVNNRDLDQAASASSTREVTTPKRRLPDGTVVGGEKVQVSKPALEYAREAQRKLDAARRISIRSA